MRGERGARGEKELGGGDMQGRRNFKEGYRKNGEGGGLLGRPE